MARFPAQTLPPVLLLAVLAVPLLTRPAGGAGLPVQAQGEQADEAYQVLAGLCERELWDLAVREGRAFLERWPRHARSDLARYRLASALWELGRRDEAAREYAALERVRAFEFAPEVSFRLGQAALAAGQPERAAQAFERTLAADRDYLRRPATFLLAEALFAAGRTAEAEPRYAALLTREGGAEHAREAEHALVWCAFRLGRHEQVVERGSAFERAHAREPEAADLVAEAAFLRGESLLALERAQEAAAAYRVALNGQQADAAQRGLGFALSAAGDHAGAARAFAQLGQRHPQSSHVPEAALHAGIERLRAGDAPGAVQALRDARVEATPEALVWLAQAQRQAGEPEAALATVERALRAAPGRDLAARLEATRGDALTDLGRSAEALAAYRAAGGEYGLYAAAVAALNAQRPEEALQLAARVVADGAGSPYRADALLVAGEASLALGRHAEAERAFARLVAEQPDGPLASRAATRAAWCRYLAGDHAGAAERFERVARAHADAPEAEEALYMAGLAREAAGDAQAARRSWTRWLERYPRGARRAEVLLGLARVEPGEEGLRRLGEALDAAPQGAAAEEALFRLGEALAEQGRGEQAMAAYERLVATSPEGSYTPAARYALAWLRYEAGEEDAAREALEPLLRSGRTSDALRLASRELQLWCLARTGAAREAARAWRELAQACDDDARVLNALTVVLDACRQTAEASAGAAVLQAFLDRGPSGALAADALVEGAWLALDGGEADVAESAVRTALEVVPREALGGARGAALAEAAFFVGEARQARGEGRQAAALYALAAPLAEGELAARVAYRQGFVALEAGDLEAAERAFSRLVSEHSGSELHGEGLYLLGEARYRRGDWPGAVAPLEQLARQQRRHECLPRALFRLGLAHGQLGDWAACERALSDLLRLERDFPQAAEAQLWRGRALAARGDVRGARGAFEAVVAADRGALGASARLELGHLARAAADLDAALAEYLKVAVLYADAPIVAEALCLAGECLEAQGEREAARARYREVLADHPDQPAAARARERLRALQDQR